MGDKTVSVKNALIWLHNFVTYLEQLAKGLIGILIEPVGAGKIKVTLYPAVV